MQHTLISHKDKEMRFATPTQETRWRAETLLTKEPSTIEWLDTLPEGDVLWDIGANVGSYTVYASIMRSMRVLAFEPEAWNLAFLNQNLALNSLDKTTAYGMAILESSVSRFTKLYLSNITIGGSNHAAGEPLNFKMEKMDPVFEQGCIAASIDYLVGQGLPAPKHIKIDVDGFEWRVILGAARTLPQVQSMLIETNMDLSEHQDMVDVLYSSGFNFDDKQVERATRKSGPFKGVAEYVWRR